MSKNLLWPHLIELRFEHNTENMWFQEYDATAHMSHQSLEIKKKYILNNMMLLSMGISEDSHIEQI